jgi:hypothetical protein
VNKRAYVYLAGFLFFTQNILARLQSCQAGDTLNSSLFYISFFSAAVLREYIAGLINSVVRQRLKNWT